MIRVCPTCGRSLPRVWQEERIRALQWLWERGATGSEIAKVLGVSRSAAIAKARRMKFRKGEETTA